MPYHSTRLRQLESLRDRQMLNEASMGKALAEASAELRRLQESNARTAEVAEEELTELSVSLQQSLLAQSQLEERWRRADAQAAELAAQRTTIEEERDLAERELREAAREFDEWDRALATEQAQKERFLRALREQRSTLGHLEAEADAATAVANTLRTEVEELRRGEARWAHRELAAERVREGFESRLSRAAFTWLVAASRAERAERAVCERRDASQKRVAFEVWRRHGKEQARWRRLRSESTRVTAARVLHSWSLHVTESRWLTRQNPAAAALRRTWLLRATLAAWLKGAEAVRAAQLAPALAWLGGVVLRAWHEHAAVSWWIRWVGDRCSRRLRWVTVQLVCAAWRTAVRGVARRRRAAEALAFRRRPRRAHRGLEALQRWACRHAVKELATAQRRRSLLRRHCMAWRRDAALQRRGREAEQFVARQLLCHAFHGLLRHAARARGARSLSARVMRRQGMYFARRFAVLRQWSTAAATLRGLRLAARVISESQASRALLRWRRRARRRRKRWQLDVVVRERMARLRRSVISAWATTVADARWRRNRGATIVGRRRFTLCHVVWSGWLRALRAAARECQAHIAGELEEARLGEAELSGALRCAKDARGDANLLRLRLVDELQGAAAEAASLTVEHEEARRAGESLAQAVGTERATARRLHDEAVELRAECEDLARQRAARHVTLEDELARALEATLGESQSLRAALQASEGQARAAAAAESAARRDAACVWQELENLHRTEAAELRERDEAVTALGAQVSRSRQSVKELEDALLRRQAFARARQAELEERRCEDREYTARGFAMFGRT
mmetsp:Transcript_44521/g.123255  ORF Transcript_44521/g.123255 Transcript_44521/m.123255 type:complete len:808 (+) Transcript_44521:155-2578(+)